MDVKCACGGKLYKGHEKTKKHQQYLAQALVQGAQVQGSSDLIKRRQVAQVLAGVLQYSSKTNNNRCAQGLADVLQSSSKRLIPCANQTALLCQSILANFGRTLTNFEWMSALCDEDYSRMYPQAPIRPHVPLLKVGGKFSDSIWLDQVKRANIIATLMISNNQRKIVLMDGHGRFVFALLHALFCRGVNVNEYEISLYDLDFHAHDWHTAFVPGNHVYGDILSVRTSLDTFYYLNFCCVSNQKHNLLTFLASAPRPVLLSFSVRNPITKIEVNEAQKLVASPHAPAKNKDRSMSLAGMILQLNASFEYRVVSRRSNFVTVVLGAY